MVSSLQIPAVQAAAELKDSGADLDLQRRVASFLADSNMPGLRQLRVDAEAGVVTLRGTVRTYYEKQLSQQRCKRVAGVVRLVDKVEVVTNSN
ncbi:MAG: BON domain-containing protein [Pirellulales bacterium]